MINEQLQSSQADITQVPLLNEQERQVFMQEALDLFMRKRQGHFIHRMYMTPAALAYWGEFMKHPDYYVTRSEVKIIRVYSSVIGDMASHPQGIIGIENGPGTISAMRKKSGAFFEAMPGLHTYIGRDWSPAIMKNIPKAMGRILPNVKIVPDLSNFLEEPVSQDLGSGRKVIAEFGVTSGNMEGFATDPFPTNILSSHLAFHRQQLNKGDLYVSTFDANQDGESVTRAYTSEWLTLWGRELFRTMKRELSIEGDFDPDSFFFQPVWHAESHVNVNNMKAMRRMEFSINGVPVTIYKDDLFGITNSYKIPLTIFSDLAASAQYETMGLFQDKQKRMTMSVLKAS